MDHSISTFLSGCARYHDFIFFAKSLDEVAENDDQPNSTFLMIDGATTGQFGEPVGWAALAMAVVKVNDRLVVCAIGPNGELWEGMPSDGSSVTGDIGIGELSWRSMAAIDGDIYACGMGRTAALRIGPLQWKDISAPKPKDTNQVLGFEDIDGFSAKDLYAVGWQGEIWQRKGSKWRQVDSPVSANLNAVCCADDGMVYVVGDNGVMLKGRDDTWREIATGLTEPLQDVRDFGGKVYVVTDFDIYELADDTLQEVTLAGGDDEPGTCLHLLRGDDGLISLGLKDVLKLHGGTWQRVV
jgi:hypothetical protein